MRRIAFLCLVVLLSGAGVACGGESDETSDTVTTTTGSGDEDGESGGGEEDGSGDDLSDGSDDGSDNGSSDADDDDNEPATTNQVKLSDVALSDLGAVDVGNAPVGSMRAANVELVSLDVDRLITQLEIGGQDATDFAITGGDCRVGSRLLADRPCALVLTFTPSSNGTRRGVLTIGVDPPFSRQVRLVGRGGIGVLPDDDKTLTAPTEDSSIAP